MKLGTIIAFLTALCSVEGTPTCLPPVQLVHNASDMLHINQEALYLLTAPTSVVISISGMARQVGKSTFQTMFAEYVVRHYGGNWTRCQGFEISDREATFTHGIWMLVIDLNNGTNIIFLDTQGLGDDDNITSTAGMQRLLAFATLVPHVAMFGIPQMIDDSTLDHLDAMMTFRSWTDTSAINFHTPLFAFLITKDDSTWEGRKHEPTKTTREDQEALRSILSKGGGKTPIRQRFRETFPNHTLFVMPPALGLKHLYTSMALYLAGPANHPLPEIEDCQTWAGIRDRIFQRVLDLAGMAGGVHKSTDQAIWMLTLADALNSHNLNFKTMAEQMFVAKEEKILEGAVNQSRAILISDTDAMGKDFDEHAIGLLCHEDRCLSPLRALRQNRFVSKEKFASAIQSEENHIEGRKRDLKLDLDSRIKEKTLTGTKHALEPGRGGFRQFEQRTESDNDVIVVAPDIVLQASDLRFKQKNVSIYAHRCVLHGPKFLLPGYHLLLVCGELHHERGLEIDVSGSDGDSVADIGTQYQGKSGEHAGSITISCQSHYGSDLHTRAVGGKGGSGANGLKGKDGAHGPGTCSSGAHGESGQNGGAAGSGGNGGIIELFGPPSLHVIPRGTQGNKAGDPGLGGAGGQGGIGGGVRWGAKVCVRPGSIWNPGCREWQTPLECAKGADGNPGQPGSNGPNGHHGGEGGTNFDSFKDMMPCSAKRTVLNFAEWLYLNGNFTSALDRLLWLVEVTNGTRCPDVSSRTIILLDRMKDGMDYFGHSEYHVPSVMESDHLATLFELSAFIAQCMAEPRKKTEYHRVAVNNATVLRAQGKVIENSLLAEKAQLVKRFTARRENILRLEGMEREMVKKGNKIAESISISNAEHAAKKNEREGKKKRGGFLKNLLRFVPIAVAALTTGPAGVAAALASNIGSRIHQVKEIFGSSQKNLADVGGSIFREQSFPEQRLRMTKVVNTITNDFASLKNIASSTWDDGRGLLGVSRKDLGVIQDKITAEVSDETADPQLARQFLEVWHDIQRSHSEINDLRTLNNADATRYDDINSQLSLLHLMKSNADATAASFRDEPAAYRLEFLSNMEHLVRGEIVYSLYLKHKVLQYESQPETWTPFRISEVTASEHMKIDSQLMDHQVHKQRRYVGRAVQRFSCSKQNLLPFYDNSDLVKDLQKGKPSTFEVPLDFRGYQGMYHVLVEGVRMCVTSSEKTPIRMRLTHSGQASQIRTHGNIRSYHHSPRVTLIDVPVCDHDALLSEAATHLGGGDTVISLSPFAPWTLQALEGWDTSKISSVTLCFSGTFQP